MARNLAIATYLACLTACCAVAQAQATRVETPLNTFGHSYYENIGVSWGLQGKGWFARFGGPAPGVVPPFGGFDPSAGGEFGTAFRRGGVSGFFRMTAGQGSDTFIGSQSPSVVVPNGGFGYFSDTIQRPFVLGIIPVVGSEPVSPLRERLARLQSEGGLKPLGTQEPASGGELRLGAERPAGSAGGVVRGEASSAERGELSVAEIRAQQAADETERGGQVDSLVEKARVAEAEGKLGLAKIYYRQAIRLAGGSRQPELETKLQALEGQSSKAKHD